MPGRAAQPALVADIGGTNIRLALLGPAGEPTQIRKLRCADFLDPAAAVDAYLEQARAEAPTAAAFAVASPVEGDHVEMTNHPWSFSIAALQKNLGLTRLVITNDFAAIALAAPRLKPGDVQKVGGGTAIPGQAIGVIGPGTGLGVSGLVSADGRSVVLATEGGHITMAPATDREGEVLTLLRRRLQHVSAERVISGQGLVNLYTAIAEIDGRPAEPLTPENVTERAHNGSCPACAAAVEMFCAMLGTAASNLALTLGARGGIYIAGGIVPKLGAIFTGSGFRQRFEAKGRFSAYMAAIPTFVIIREIPAFLGLAALLDQDQDM